MFSSSSTCRLDAINHCPSGCNISFGSEDIPVSHWHVGNGSVITEMTMASSSTPWSSLGLACNLEFVGEFVWLLKLCAQLAAGALTTEAYKFSRQATLRFQLLLWFLFEVLALSWGGVLRWGGRCRRWVGNLLTRRRFAICRRAGKSRIPAPRKGWKRRAKARRTPFILPRWLSLAEHCYAQRCLVCNRLACLQLRGGSKGKESYYPLRGGAAASAATKRKKREKCSWRVYSTC